MNQAKRLDLLLGVELSDEEAQSISAVAGDECDLILRSADEYACRAADITGDPFVAWIPWRIWQGLPGEARKQMNGHIGLQKILILADDDLLPSYEEVLEQGFITAVRGPLTEDKVEEALFKAREMRYLHEDIVRMTDEIDLTREILANKIDCLDFLNRFITGTSESKNPAGILVRAAEDLNTLLPLSSISAVFWEPDDDGDTAAEVFLSARSDEKIFNAWLDFLLERGSEVSGCDLSEPRLTYLMDAADDEVWPQTPPNPGLVTTLPLNVGGDDFGCLILELESPFRPTRERLDLLKTVRCSLGLALSNALHFRKETQERDGDFSTPDIHEITSALLDEGRTVSVMALRPANITSIREDIGEEAAVSVALEIDRILKATIGHEDSLHRLGDDFIVVLPGRDREHAAVFAERLRKRIGVKQFVVEGRAFRISVTAGVVQPAGPEDTADAFTSLMEHLTSCEDIEPNDIDGNLRAENDA